MKRSSVTWIKRSRGTSGPSSSTRTALSSLQALSLLYRVRGAWPKLVDMCLQEARYTTDAQRRADSHARAAEIYETRLDAVDDAIEHYHRSLNAMPDPPRRIQGARAAALGRAQAQGAHSTLRKTPWIARPAAVPCRTCSRLRRSMKTCWRSMHSRLKPYKRVLQQDTGHLAAVHAWQRSAARAHRPRELLEAARLRDRADGRARSAGRAPAPSRRGAR